MASGGHLRPQEPGELAGDRRSDHAFGVLASGEVPGTAAQAQLGGPRSSDHLKRQSLVALGDLRAHIRAMLGRSGGAQAR